MMRRTSVSTSSRVRVDGPVTSKGCSRPSPGTTLTGPMASDMPQRPTMWRAMAVTSSRSDSAPVVTSPYTSSSAARPPRASVMRPRR